ncbi:MAG: type II toxin-antitoxin system VapC family toxin [Acidobacteriia bacterium]|nr:type II toxin-antitoxin system VapC family toxin [Terriglobia bacterium]
MAELLDSLPNGSDVLVDANLFVYGLTAKSEQCKRLLGRCSREEVTGITLFEVVNNATHQFMKGEALQKGFCERQPMKYLSEHPEQVKVLTDYWANTQRLLALNLLFLPVERDIVTSAQTERQNAGLLTNDSVIVAAMRGYGITRIATSDRQFDTVAGITVFSPNDLP